MESKIKTPCDDSLKAMPGDSITFVDPATMLPMDGIVKVAGWQPSPKGGKVWTYECTEGQLVPHMQVSQVIKPVVEKTVTTHLIDDHRDDELRRGLHVDPIEKIALARENLIYATSASDFAPQLKTAIYCLLEGDSKNLEVAAFLISQRARQVKELERAGIDFNLVQPTKQNPKEDL